MRHDFCRTATLIDAPTLVQIVTRPLRAHYLEDFTRKLDDNRGRDAMPYAAQVERLHFPYHAIISPERAATFRRKA